MNITAEILYIYIKQKLKGDTAKYTVVVGNHNTHFSVLYVPSRESVRMKDINNIIN